MLSRRLVGTLLLRDGIVVQSLGFARYLPVGRLEVAVEYLSRWGVDEILVLDINARREGRSLSCELIAQSAKRCFVPLTAGGGLTRIEQVDALLRSGADKICLNGALASHPYLVTEVAARYGRQCVTICIDVTGQNGAAMVFNPAQPDCTVDLLENRVRLAESLGAGEIVVQSVDRDGSYQGYDLSSIHRACEASSIPILALGGAGQPQHLVELFAQTRAEAACVANMLHFSEHSVIVLKQALMQAQVPVRLDTRADYAGHQWDERCRLAKLPDEELDRLLNVRIEKEVI